METYARDLAALNAEKRRERMVAARAKGTHTAEQWLWLQRACGFKCVRCGTSGVPLQRDHIQPVYQGGSDGIDNLQPLCVRCNTSKGPEAEDFRPPAVLASLGLA